MREERDTGRAGRCRRPARPWRPSPPGPRASRRQPPGAGVPRPPAPVRLLRYLCLADVSWRPLPPACEVFVHVRPTLLPAPGPVGGQRTAPSPRSTAGPGAGLRAVTSRPMDIEVAFTARAGLGSGRRSGFTSSGSSAGPPTSCRTRTRSCGGWPTRPGSTCVVDAARAGPHDGHALGRGPRRHPGRARRAGAHARRASSEVGTAGAQGDRAGPRREHRGDHRGALAF